MLAICNGMPRAGSTLQYNVARCLVEKTGSGTAHAFITADEENPRRIATAQLQEWATDDAWRVVKTHEVLDALPDLLATGRLRVLYVYRDLRDVAVSIQRAFATTGDDLMRRLEEGVTWYHRLDVLRSEHPGRFLWQRYEDVYRDLPSAIGDTSTFLGLEADAALLHAVHAECRLESAEKITQAARRQLARALNALGKQSPARADAFAAQVRDAGWAVQGSLLHHHHISAGRGEPGGWRETLSEDNAALITGRFRDWLVARGYEVG
jgi:hypothetical protein